MMFKNHIQTICAMISQAFGSGLSSILHIAIALCVIGLFPIQPSFAQSPPIDPDLNTATPSPPTPSFTPPNWRISCNDPGCAICAPYGGTEMPPGTVIGCIPDYACDLCESAINVAINQLHSEVRDEMIDLREFMQIDFWRNTVEAGLQNATNMMTANGITQAGIIGSFFDAKQQNEVKLALDRNYTDTRRAYQPSTALCRFGTAKHGLASSENLAIVQQTLMSHQAQSRHLGATGTAGHEGAVDTGARLSIFASRFCDPYDSGGRLVGSAASPGLCGESGGFFPAAGFNKDINVTDTLFTPATMDVNFVDTNITGDEMDLLELSKNLYGYQIATRMDPKLLEDGDDEATELNRQNFYLLRSILAKRNVAENSFFAIAAKKSRGSGASADALAGIYQSLGIPLADAQAMLSNAPSYEAQMEVLTKKIYQSPTFITSLIDSPENVKRQQAAMMAIELMQRRDAYKSMLRQEVLLAVMMDLYTEDRFDEAKGRLNELQQ